MSCCAISSKAMMVAGSRTLPFSTGWWPRSFRLKPRRWLPRLEVDRGATDLPYGYSHGLRRLAGDPAPMTDEESAAHASLLAEYRR